VLSEGDLECPEGWRDAERQVFYEEVFDERSCSQCACSPPEGALCVAQIRVFADSACTDTEERLAAFVDTDKGGDCFGLMQGISLGSKKASIVVDIPGTCKPTGGETQGEVVLGKPTTFCCLS
jgi:hypothetical protein